MPPVYSSDRDPCIYNLTNYRADAVAKGGVGSKARAGPSRSQIGKGPAGGRQTYDDDDDNGGYEGEGIVPDDDEFDD